MTDSHEKFVSPSPPPEGLDRELLTIMMEECAEIAQRCSKALRFGITEIQPGQPHTNGYRIGLELGDLYEVARRLHVRGILVEASIIEGSTSKEQQLSKYLQSREFEPTRGQE